MGLIPTKATNDPITAAWANSVRDQGVQVCTSSTRPGSPFEGQTIYETDTHKLMMHNGFGWIEVSYGVTSTAWSPTITQGSTRSGTVNLGLYRREGLSLKAQLHWISTVAGSTADVAVSMPGSFSPPGVAASAYQGEVDIGQFWLYTPSGSWGSYRAMATPAGIKALANGGTTYVTTALQVGSKIVLNIDTALA